MRIRIPRNKPAITLWPNPASENNSMYELEFKLLPKKKT